MSGAEQAEVIAFLEAFGGGHVRRIETHISIVLLHEARVFKLKRAVKLPYLDFSSAVLRLKACETEFALNRRTAPGLYIGVRRIMRGRDGALSFDGSGELVDAVVEMRRFDGNGLFDVMAREGRLTPILLTQLAQTIAAFHEDAAISTQRSGSHAIEAALAANEGGFAQARIFGAQDVARLNIACRARLATVRALLDARSEAGKVRRCHGDLHLRNICLFEGNPTLFDCLEFSEDLATTDVLYDLAFLLMDLWHRDLKCEANIVFNRYIDATGDDEALALLPFFMAIRAAVRAHVGATSAGNAGDDDPRVSEARQYLALALDLLGEQSPRLLAVAGLSGSGKSSVAAGLAPHIGPPPGARILSTDRLRKQLAGVAAEDKLPAESYTPQSSLRVYEAQRLQAARVLRGGWSAIADGVFLKAEERAAIEIVANEAGVRFDGLWLDAPAHVLTRRVAVRVNDPSDATVEVLTMQLANNPGPLDWQSADASGSLESSIANARKAIG